MSGVGLHRPTMLPAFPASSSWPATETLAFGAMFQSAKDSESLVSILATEVQECTLERQEMYEIRVTLSVYFITLAIPMGYTE